MQPARRTGPQPRAVYVPPMAKMRKKSDLPVKICITCGRPMVWRKAWAKVWDEVRYCSDRCRMQKPPPKG